MRHLILTAFVVGLVMTATGGFAYEFSEHERQVDADFQRRLQDQRQLQEAQSQARQNSQENDRLHDRTKQFDPSEYRPQAPYNMFDSSGRASVCRRNASGAVFCQ